LLGDLLSVGQDDELVNDHGEHLWVQLVHMVGTVGVIRDGAVVLRQKHRDIRLWKNVKLYIELVHLAIILDITSEDKHAV
jgi:hypothetical protein